MSAPDNFPQIMHNAKEKKKAVTASTTGVISLKARGRSFENKQINEWVDGSKLWSSDPEYSQNSYMVFYNTSILMKQNLTEVNNRGKWVIPIQNSYMF